MPSHFIGNDLRLYFLYIYIYIYIYIYCIFHLNLTKQKHNQTKCISHRKNALKRIYSLNKVSWEETL